MEYDLQAGLQHSGEWGSRLGRNSDPELAVVLMESIQGDGLPVTDHAKAVAGAIIEVMWSREVSWSKPIQFREF
jgi:hypothetical protein